jgi:hypothetical protein
MAPRATGTVPIANSSGPTSMDTAEIERKEGPSHCDSGVKRSRDPKLAQTATLSGDLSRDGGRPRRIGFLRFGKHGNGSA